VLPLIHDEVGWRQAMKSRLSEYLWLVRGGETVLVTDRDEVVAELRPTRKRPAIADSLDEILDSLAECGEILGQPCQNDGEGGGSRHAH